MAVTLRDSAPTAEGGGGSPRPPIPGRTVRSVSVCPAYMTKIAAAFGFLAFVLLTGGNANAQTSCYGGATGREDLSLAVEAIEEVHSAPSRYTRQQGP